MGHNMALVVSHWSLIEQREVEFHASPCGLCEVKSGTVYNVFLPVLQFSPVSIILLLLHTHSSIYHPRCIMFFSQHFSFPLSGPLHHSTIAPHSFIHLNAFLTCRRMTRLFRTFQAAVLFQKSIRTVHKSTFIWSLKVNCTQASLSVQSQCIPTSDVPGTWYPHHSTSQPTWYPHHSTSHPTAPDLSQQATSHGSWQAVPQP